MTPELLPAAAEDLRRFVRNFNPAQRKATQRMLQDRRRAGGDGPRWTEWTEAVMKAWQGRQWSWDMDGLSLHNYTVVQLAAEVRLGRLRRGRVRPILKSTLEMDGLVTTHSAIMDKYDPQKKIALVVDEWGAWYAPLPGSNPGFLVQQNSLRDALLAALNLNIFARHADRVRMANIAQMVNVLQAMILTDKEKMVLTPTYHVFKMYVPFQDATFVPVTFDAGTYTHGEITLPRVDAIAARDGAGKLWLAVTNLDPTRPAEIAARSPASPRRGGRRDTDRSRGRQRQHLRGAGHGRAQAHHGLDAGRSADADARAQVGHRAVRSQVRWWPAHDVLEPGP